MGPPWDPHGTPMAPLVQVSINGARLLELQAQQRKLFKELRSLTEASGGEGGEGGCGGEGSEGGGGKACLAENAAVVGGAMEGCSLLQAAC